MIFSLSLLQVVILLPISALLIAWLYIQWAYRRQIALLRKFPSPIPAYPLVGHLLGLKVDFGVGAPTWKIALGHPSGACCIWLGSVPLILITKPEYMKVILNNSNSLSKDTLYDALKYVFGNGLFTAPVSFWKVSRKHINPMFHSENLQHYLPVINKTALHLVEDLSEHDGKQMFDCADYFFAFTLINTLKLLFGPNVDIDCKSEEFQDTLKAIKMLSKLLGERAYNPLMKIDFVFNFMRKHAKSLMDNCRKYGKVLIEKRKEVKSTMESNGHIEQVKTFQDMFNVLKNKGPMFNEEYMMDEIITLTGGGTETNAVTLSWCLVALGSHPEVQNKLYDEIISVVGEGLEVYEEDIAKLTYMDQVIKETIRCFSVVPLAARKCDQDVQLDGYTIPKDTTVVLSFLGMHHDEEVFPEPHKFDPDRFSPDNTSKRHSHSFLPFSGGPRNCVGKNFAMLTMKTVLVHLLKNYEIKSHVDKTKINFKFCLTMLSIDGYKIKIRKRV